MDSKMKAEILKGVILSAPAQDHSGRSEVYLRILRIPETG